MKKQKKLIDEQIQKLPKVSQEAMKASGWEEKVRKIGSENGLLLDEIEAIYKEALLVMVGLTDSNLFVPNIERHAEISSKTAEKIADQIFLQIFKPMLADIQKRSEEEAKDHAELFESTIPNAKAAPSLTPAEPARDALLEEIENPGKGQPSLTRLKLDDIFIKKPTVSDASDAPAEPAPSLAQKLNITTQKDPAPESYQTKDHDPYLEPIN